jgi:hypothetical protein
VGGPVLDVHLHLRSTMDGNFKHIQGSGVSKAVLLTSVNAEDHAKEVVAAYPDRFVRFASIDVTQPDAVVRLRDAIRDGAIGLGEVKSQVEAAGPEMRRLLYALAAELDMPITTAVPGGQLPYTPYGADRWKNVDTKDDPTGLCLPVGPSRAFTAPFPVYILQTPKVIGALFEYQTTWRMFYVDSKHPADLGDYGSEFMGHSTAQWETDALVVDTIGINERSWLDTAGHEHSDKLHLTERFEKINDDNIKYTLTYDDPVFFTRPVTIVRNFKRGGGKGSHPSVRVRREQCR